MKTTKYTIAINAFLLVIAAFLFQACYTTPHQGSTNPPENTYSTDQQGYNIDDLNNYGEWVSVPGYGRVWRPSVVSDWAPYDNGHWSYVDGNWTWVSYEPFGWIVYHYGYWYNDPFYGWVWIPADNQWSPARVRWMNYDNYVCWAPLPPPGRNIVYRDPWDAGSGRYWHSVRREDFARDNVNNYRVTPPARIETGDRGTAQREPNTGNTGNDRRGRGTVENRPPSGDVTGSRNRNQSKDNGDRSRDKTQNPSEKNNTGERGRTERNSSARNETGQRNSTETIPPAKNDIEKASGTKIENNRSRYRDVKTPTRVIKKQELPPEDQKKVEKNEKQVEKKVLVPKKNADKK